MGIELLKTISMENLASLLVYLKRFVSPKFCVHNFKFTKRWIKKNNLSKDILQVFIEDGVTCDCEILKNELTYFTFFGKELEQPRDKLLFLKLEKFFESETDADICYINVSKKGYEIIDRLRRYWGFETDEDVLKMIFNELISDSDTIKEINFRCEVCGCETQIETPFGLFCRCDYVSKPNKDD